MFAVIKTGGKQYKVAADEVIKVELIPGEEGETVSFGEVLMVGGEDGTVIGNPVVEGASVTGTVVGLYRTPKVYAFKKRRRHNSKRIRGHRQDLTMVKITEIVAAGTAPAKKPRAKKAKAEAEAPAEAAAAASAE